ncbi:hypothetical protein Scep_009805 [Stephania cephalantha]|uniref:Uncharacterized protein n=1 Tax=Stephania cephalantha TaxID=152367 RepID=A0AAP0PEN4_9MAGN
MESATELFRFESKGSKIYLSMEIGRTFKVNGQRLKPYYENFDNSLKDGVDLEPLYLPGE